MNWDQVKGDWKQVQGKVKAQWGKLTDDDLTTIAGKREELAGKIQHHYGLAKEQAETELDKFVLSLKIVALIVALSSSYLPAQAKHAMTITERQESLMKTVAKGQKSGDLTLKEATSLRNGEAKITAKESKMKSKNGGKLSYENIATVEHKLNKMSNKIHKEQLAKRELK